MNRQDVDILKVLARGPLPTQRAIAEATGHSLGVVNRSVRELIERGFLDQRMRLTDAALRLCSERAPRNAIILAAGMGMRMAPINVVNPKALLEVLGEPLIERQIRQLREVGVCDITVVVGFMKEKFDYLIDDFGVHLVVNPAYVHKNNLASLALVADRISNTYLVPCDVWCEENPFCTCELSSWYLVTDRVGQGEVRVNRKGELAYIGRGDTGNAMVGIAYVLEQEAEILRGRLAELAADPRHDGDFWEEALRQGDRMLLPAKVVPDAGVVEIDTYEQLRDLNGGSEHLGPAQIEEAASALGVDPHEVTDVRLLKKGLMNSTFALSTPAGCYAMRVPADSVGGTDRWEGERDAYRAMGDLGISDAPVLLDPTTGHKLTPYLDGARPCDPGSEDDLVRAMALLRRLHQAPCAVPRSFDPFRGVEQYEALRGRETSIFRDYAATKERVMALRDFARRHAAGPCLIHVDPAPENFLFVGEGAAGEPLAVPATEGLAGSEEIRVGSAPAGTVAGEAGQASGDPPTPGTPSAKCEGIRLIDWEYAGMGDPHVDVALFCIYSLYDRPEIDHLIDLYFEPDGGCDTATRAKIYCYVAAGGLLWSNWCEYKWHQGVEFGEYSLKQYRYAKDFARLAMELIEQVEESCADAPSGVATPLTRDGTAIQHTRDGAAAPPAPDAAATPLTQDGAATQSSSDAATLPVPDAAVPSPLDTAATSSPLGTRPATPPVPETAATTAESSLYHNPHHDLEEVMAHEG